jgi:hypothetical protein
MGELFMKLLIHLFQHLIPVSLIGAFGLIFISSTLPTQTNRIDGFGVDLVGAPPLTMESVDSQLNAIQQSGSKYVRIEMNWSMIESSPDVYNWSASVPLDLFFTSAKAREIKAVAVVTGGPLYLTSNGGALDQKSLGERWSKFIQAAVDHFGEQVDIWEIGYQVNSTNGMSSFLTPASPQAFIQPDPIFFSKLLRSASKIIKNADPNNEVWMGSLVSATAGNCAMNPLTFVLEINGAKGWNSINALSYQPKRGGAAPELPSTSGVNPACGSALPVDPGNLSTEVQALQELARQLGGKPVYITGLSWNQEELIRLQSNRTIEIGLVEADMLVRGSVMLMAKNLIPLIFWQADLPNQPSARIALTNLGSVIDNAKSIGQAQGQSGAVHEYRFQKGADIKVVAWRTQDGDTPQPVNLGGLAPGQLMAFPINVGSLSNGLGTPIAVDATGNAIVMLNERPVLFLGKLGSWENQLQSSMSDRLDIWKNEIQKTVKHLLNDQKAAFLRMLENLFNQAKESAVDWGEQKIDELLN